MINLAGKTLVLINLLFSGLVAAFALAVYTQRVDWGWSEPRAEMGERIPSEIDKRTAAYQKQEVTKRFAENDLKTARSRLTSAEFAWHNFHLWADMRLEKLYSSSDPKLDVRRVEIQAGRTLPDPQQLGRPRLEKGAAKLSYKQGNNVKEETITKSFLAYHGELLAVQKKLEEKSREIAKAVAEQKKWTLRITGEIDPKTKQTVKPGAYDLLQREVARQEQLRKEIATIQPIWVRHLVDAQLLVDRHKRLSRRLGELKGRKASP